MNLKMQIIVYVNHAKQNTTILTAQDATLKDAYNAIKDIIQITTTNCNTCPGGYYCPNGKIIKCPVGTYSTGGAVSCIMCPGGSYSSTTGASSCIKCSAGYYSNQGAASCTKCSTKYPNCKTCNNTQCIECETNYKLSDDKQKCEKKDCPQRP